MSANDLTYGVKLIADGKQLVGEVKSARDEMVNLKKATDDLTLSARQLAEGQMGMTLSESNAKDKAWALANGYKEMDGQLVKLSKTTQEASLVNAGATRELMVLGHEAMTGNFSRMPGTLLVLANRSGLVASGMLGMAAAIAAPVAALGALALAIHEGRQETAAMDRSLAMTGDFAGQTRGSLRALAEQVSSSSQLTIGQSKEVVTQLAANGKIGAEAFSGAAQAIASYVRISGESAEKVTPMIVKMLSDPAKGAEELNKTMHFLSMVELNRIDILERTGHAADAQTLSLRLLNAELDKQKRLVPEATSYWDAFKKTMSGAGDWAEGAGRDKTVDEKLKAARDEVALLKNRISRGLGGPVQQDNLRRAEIDVNFYAAQKRKEDAEAATKSAAAEKNQYDQTTLALAKQNSELWKNYEKKLDIARLQGANADALAEIPAPSMTAVYADASAQLQKKVGRKDASEAYSAAIAEQESYQRDLSGLIKRSGEEQKRLLDAGEISQADYIETMKTLRQAELRGLIESYQDQELAALDHKKKSDVIKYGGEADNAQAQMDELELRKQNELKALARKQLDAAAGITRPLDADYRKADEARARAAELDLMSASQQRLAQALDVVKDRARATREALDVKFPQRERESSAYQDALKKINDAEKEAEQSTRDWAARQDELNASWERGADIALRNYLDQVKSVSAQSERLFTDAYRAMDEAGVQFVRHQKIDFSSLADSIINDMIRIEWQRNVTAPLASAMGSSSLIPGLGALLGFGGNSPTGLAGMDQSMPIMVPNANGNVFGNGLYDSPTAFKFASGSGFGLGVMGEAGPEAVMPLTRGPDGKLGVMAQGGSGSQITVNQTVNINAPNASAETVSQIRALMPAFIAENARSVVGAVNQALLSRGQQPIRA